MISSLISTRDSLPVNLLNLCEGKPSPADCVMQTHWGYYCVLGILLCIPIVFVLFTFSEMWSIFDNVTEEVC